MDAEGNLHDGAGVIRLRATIERGLRHRWLGPLLLVTLVLLLGLLVLHSTSDQLEPSSALLICAALSMLLALLPIAPRLAPASRRASSPRASPLRASSARQHALRHPGRFSPLRL